MSGLRLSLRWSLLLRIVVPLLAAVTVALYGTVREIEQRMEQRLQEDLELVARAIQQPVSYSMERDRPGSVRSALESVFEIDRVYGAYVYDHAGEQIAAVGAVRPKEDPGAVLDLAVEGQETGKFEQIEGREVYSYFLPLADETDGRIIGLLQVTRRASDFVDYFAEIRRQMIMAIGIATLIILALILLGHYRAVGRHINSLIGTMTRVKSGHREARATAGGPRELMVLGHALNDMLDAIHSAEQEIGERREAQANLEEKLRQSEKLAAIGRLSAGIAHELGAPLSVVDGRARRVLREGGLSETQERNVDDVRGEVRRMSRIVHQLLDFGRASQGEFRRLPAETVVRGACRQVEELAAGHGIELTVEGGPNAAFIEADPGRMEQALVNLLRNGVQAASSRVICRWDMQAGEVVFEVEDDGPGIAGKDMPRLFEPFFTTKSVGEGTGLGLAVVHGVIEEHRGTVEVAHGGLGGARFRVRLPLAVMSDEKEVER
jgi:signal transduction histidine kinase